jgi:RsmE family RNA methyltransferase
LIDRCACRNDNGPAVNLILFESDEIDRPLSRTDRRATHITDILRRKVGDEFDAGLVNGPRGKGIVEAIDSKFLSLAFRWGATPPLLDALTVIIGLPRPQTARDLLRELTSLGVREIHFVRTEKSDPGYASSKLWSSNEWRRLLIAGAEQAFDTRLPEVTHGREFEEVLASLPRETARFALDNYDAAQALGRVRLPAEPGVVVAIGPERGWSNGERERLRQHRFELVNLGTRVLRVETAAIAAASILKAQRNAM